MRSAGELCAALTGWLRESGLDAVTAWPQEKRERPGEAVAAVSLRGLECGAAGYQDYLGEQFNEATGEWEELYGRQMTLTFGLDLYAATAQAVGEGLEKLEAALLEGGPDGMRPEGFSAGETAYQNEARRYFCPVQAKFRVWAAAAAREDAAFLDFTIKGEKKA